MQATTAPAEWTLALLLPCFRPRVADRALPSGVRGPVLSNHGFVRNIQALMRCLRSGDHAVAVPITRAQ